MSSQLNYQSNEVEEHKEYFAQHSATINQFKILSLIISGLYIGWSIERRHYKTLMKHLSRVSPSVIGTSLGGVFNLMSYFVRNSKSSSKSK